MKPDLVHCDYFCGTLSSQIYCIQIFNFSGCFTVKIIATIFFIKINKKFLKNTMLNKIYIIVFPLK